MRQTARRSLEETMVEGILFTVDELMQGGLPVAPESIEAYNDAIFTLQQKKGAGHMTSLELVQKKCGLNFSGSAKKQGAG